MPRTINLRPTKVHLEMSYPSGGDLGRRAEVRLVDVASHVTIAVIRLDPQQFFDLVTTHISGAELDAELVDAEAYQHIGLNRHHWTRHIGYGVDIDDATAWAEELRSYMHLHTASVENRQGGLSATWELWTDQDEDELSVIKYYLDQAALPPRKNP